MELSAPDRIFKVWSYSVTHRSLLLRSDADVQLAAAPRIEVCANAVQVMFVRPMMKGLTIRRVTDGEEIDLLARKYDIEEHLDFMFKLESASGQGLIVSGQPSWARATCPVDAPSFFSRANEVHRYDDAVTGRIE
ncbi:hypothetical protein I3F60_04690 [Streptomyces sp. MUM 136J]|uniref:hypothetical protein n=1 Tax=Streptomyces sp. MUM 136J TaxID=2791992 RepID=UPI001F03459C|nr:hypothetical protein [Streptomyces sp. MUM 136J]MCH0568562.1 hypothetical protein [Streptomyces sp. MUM 136J]